MEPRPPPVEVWAHPGVEPRRSPIDGRGLLARADIAAGVTVLRVGGRLVDTGELARMIAATAGGRSPYVDSITVDEDAHLVMPPGSVAHFANHSCDPTLWHVGPYDIATRRPVVAGEELTVDYGTNSGAGGFAVACRCGSARCRGRVTSGDWRDPRLQARYAGHWTPALQRRIERLAP